MESTPFSTPTAWSGIWALGGTNTCALSINAPVNSPTNLVLTASASDDGGVSKVEFFEGANKLGQATASPYTITWNNVGAGSFALTARATDDLGAVSTSSVVNLTVILPATNALKLWLKADAIAGLTNGATIQTWADSSGATNNATQATAAYRPAFMTNVVHGKPVVRFDGTNDSFTFQNNPVNGATQAEAFVVLKASADQPTANRALWGFGSSGSSTYPNTAGLINEDFGSTTVRNLGDPAQPLDQFHLYNVSAKTNDWSARINGVSLCTTHTNSFGVWNPPTLGMASYYFAGDLAEVLIYSRTLTEEEKDAVGRYLNGKYAFVTNLPPVPAGLLVAASSESQLTVSWTNTVTTVGVTYTVERKNDPAGSYTQAGKAWSSHSFLDTGLSPDSNYFYRVKAANVFGESAYSAEVSPLVGSITNPLTGSILTAGSNSIWATAADTDGSVTQVQFYAGIGLIGTATNSPYSIVWNNSMFGSHDLFVKVWDHGGNSRISQVTRILMSLDTDGDGVNGYAEILHGTNPYLKDTDGDGIWDGQDAFPLDPSRSAVPDPDPGDTTPPDIILDEPSDAIPVQ